MRRLRVIVRTVGGGMPALVATLLAPVDVACGGEANVQCVVDASAPDAVTDASTPETAPAPDSFIAVDAPLPICEGVEDTQIVALPPPGVPAEPGQICAITVPPATSNTAARVTLTKYSPSQGTALGFVAIAPSLTVVGAPVVTVTQATRPDLATMQVAAVAAASGGFSFAASWPAPLASATDGPSMTVKVSFSIDCGDGGMQTADSVTTLVMCIDGESFDWVSSGDACTVCRIIAEMAPTPIVSDNRGDDLPLGRVIRIRVVEVARAGRDVLLFAENDAGDSAAYEWRVSAGSIERISDDVVLWRLPSDADDERPFGQIAVWNDAGAVVENFVWGQA